MKKINLVLLLFLIIVIVITGAFAFNYYTEKKEQEEDRVFGLLTDYPIKGQVYIENFATEDVIKEVERTLKAKKYVENIEYISKEQALKELKTRFKNVDNIFEKYKKKNNILYDSYRFTIKLKNIREFNKEYFDEIKSDLKKITSVDKVGIDGDVYLDVYEEYGIEGLEEYVKSDDVLETMKKLKKLKVEK